MLKKIISVLLDQPFLTSLLVTDLAILIFHRPPFLFSLIMIGFLIATSMYLGQKLAPFKQS
jgi:hypothetical protein